MGLLDWLFGKKKEPEELTSGPSVPPSPERVARFPVEHPRRGNLPILRSNFGIGPSAVRTPLVGARLLS